MTDTSREKIRERLRNVDRIKDLLFGNELEDYQERFASCEGRLERLESEFTQFQKETSDRLDRFQSDMSTEIRSAIDSLEKKLKYIGSTDREKIDKLDRKLKFQIERNASSIDSLDRDFETKICFFEEKLTRTRQTCQKDVEVLRERVFAELEQKFTDLEEAKISRTELAEFLFELCFKVKGTEKSLELRESENGSVKAELLLPE